MRKRAPLPSDVSRCHGSEGATICQQCARRIQMEYDDITRYYPHSHIVPVNGRCVYHIPEADHA